MAGRLHGISVKAKNVNDFGATQMLQMMYRFFQIRRAIPRDQDKALLRAKLIAVAVARTTHYERALQA